MKLFKKNKNTLHSTYALKKGSIATAITAAFIICVVLLNVLITALANKYPLTIDLTSTKVNSISQENIKYIKAVEKDVNIYIYAAKEDFETGYFSEYASAYYNASDTTGKYYSQTASLIEKYAKYNDRLSIEFVDARSADSTKLKTQFADFNFNYGDILLDCGGRQKLITFEDIYTLYDETGYASSGYYPYTVSGNNIETALTSAIYYVTNDNTAKLGLFTDHCDPEMAIGLLTSLKNYNYEIVEIEGPAIQNIDSDLDALLFYDLKADLTTEAVYSIESFLDNDGKKGKTLLYFGSAASPALPNFEGMLQKWGIGYGEGLLYETASGYYYQNEANFYLFNTQSEYTKSISDNRYAFISSENRPMEILDTDENTSVTSLLETSNTAVIKTDNGDSTKAPATPVALAAAQTIENATSRVIAFSSVDFFTTELNNYQDVGNINFVCETLNYSTGRDLVDIELAEKTVDASAFTKTISSKNVNTVLIIFVFLLPISVVVCGIIIFVKRKNR